MRTRGNSKEADNGRGPSPNAAFLEQTAEECLADIETGLIRGSRTETR